MKKYLFLLLSALVLTACGGDEPAVVSKKKGEIRPFELVRIEAAKGVKLRAEANEEEGLLTALEIAKRGDAISGTMWDEPDQEFTEGAERGFGKDQRDITSANPALLMQSEDILDRKGLKLGWIKGYNYVILDKNNDTIAYLPNAILRKAEQDIYKAYADSNFIEVYRIFNEGFKFKPITGKMWRELRKDSLQ